MSKRPYTIYGTERFATSRSQASKAEQTNRGHAEAGRPVGRTPPPETSRWMSKMKPRGRSMPGLGFAA